MNKSTQEIWKDIPGYEGFYQVSNHGRVKSLARKNAVGHNLKEKVLSSSGTTYIHVALCKNGNKFPIGMHQLVAKAFIPNPNNLPFINHIDSDPTNNHVSNLEWCTPQHNVIHGFKAGGRLPSGAALLKGSKNPTAKLTSNDVRLIRVKHKYGTSALDLSKQFSVDRSIVYKIVKRKIWNHI